MEDSERGNRFGGTCSSVAQRHMGCHLREVRVDDVSVHEQPEFLRGRRTAEAISGQPRVTLSMNEITRGASTCKPKAANEMKGIASSLAEDPLN